MLCDLDIAVMLLAKSQDRRACISMAAGALSYHKLYLHGDFKPWQTVSIMTARCRQCSTALPRKASAPGCCCTPAVLPVPAQHWNALQDILSFLSCITTPTSIPPAEYHRREAELERFVHDAGYEGIPVIELPYEPQEFYDAVRG